MFVSSKNGIPLIVRIFCLSFVFFSCFLVKTSYPAPPYQKTFSMNLEKSMNEYESLSNQTKASNPFTLSFGARPFEYIGREEDKKRMIQQIDSNPPSAHSFIITGVRGSGKQLCSRPSRNISKRRTIGLRLT